MKILKTKLSTKPAQETLERNCPTHPSMVLHPHSCRDPIERCDMVVAGRPGTTCCSPGEHSDRIHLCTRTQSEQ